jgi:hypothetical protein
MAAPLQDLFAAIAGVSITWVKPLATNLASLEAGAAVALIEGTLGDF